MISMCGNGRFLFSGELLFSIVYMNFWLLEFYIVFLYLREVLELIIFNWGIMENLRLIKFGLIISLIID